MRIVHNCQTRIICSCAKHAHILPSFTSTASSATVSNCVKKCDMCRRCSVGRLVYSSAWWHVTKQPPSHLLLSPLHLLKKTSYTSSFLCIAPITQAHLWPAETRLWWLISTTRNIYPACSVGRAPCHSVCRAAVHLVDCVHKHTPRQDAICSLSKTLTFFFLFQFIGVVNL